MVYVFVPLPHSLSLCLKTFALLETCTQSAVEYVIGLLEEIGNTLYDVIGCSRLIKISL